MENMLPQETLVLEQRVFMKGFQRFEIHQDDSIKITVKRVGLHRQFKLPIWQINPNPERILHSQTGDLIGFIFLECSRCCSSFPYLFPTIQNWEARSYSRQSLSGFYPRSAGDDGEANRLMFWLSIRTQADSFLSGLKSRMRKAFAHSAKPPPKRLNKLGEIGLLTRRIKVWPEKSQR